LPISVKTALLLLIPLETDSSFSFKSTILSFRPNVDVTKLSISELPVAPGLDTPPLSLAFDPLFFAFLAAFSFFFFS